MGLVFFGSEHEEGQTPRLSVMNLSTTTDPLLSPLTFASPWTLAEQTWIVNNAKMRSQKSISEIQRKKRSISEIFFVFLYVWTRVLIDLEPSLHSTWFLMSIFQWMLLVRVRPTPVSILCWAEGKIKCLMTLQFIPFLWYFVSS